MQFFNIVNGECRSGTSTDRGANPRTEQALWDAPLASTQDLDDAVAAAQAAFKSWSLTTIDERKAVVAKISETYTEHAEELQDILAQETGKSVSRANSFLGPVGAGCR